MSKLEDMLSRSRHLAARLPRAGDRLLWTTQEFAPQIAAFLYRSDQTPGLAVDPSTALLAAIEAGTAPCHVVWSNLDPSDGAADPTRFTTSRRRPTELSLQDDQVVAAVRRAGDLRDLQDLLSARRRADAGAPWLETGSCGWVAAPFLLNGLPPRECAQALGEIRRVLADDGTFRSVVLAADEPATGFPLAYGGYPVHRAPLEDEIGPTLAAAGFHGMTMAPLSADPILTAGGAELRLFAVEAFLGTAGICLEQGDAAVYLGPWKSVQDDDGHTYPRGVRIAVCAKTAGVLSRAPYAGAFLILKAYGAPALADAPLFDCSRDGVRAPAETKGRVPPSRAPGRESQRAEAECGPGCGC